MATIRINGEVFTVVGIVYLMLLEKRRLQAFLKEHA